MPIPVTNRMSLTSPVHFTGLATVRPPAHPDGNLPVLDRSNTVSILGSSQEENPRMQPYYKALEQIAAALSARGYNIVTGGSPGANYHANLGALPEKSFVVHVDGWESVLNERPNSRNSLYRNYATAESGAARTGLLNRISKALIIAPGGPGSLQEAAVALEQIYYGVPGSPDKIILLGQRFWKPLMAQLATMIRWDAAKPKLKDTVALVNVQPGRNKQTVDEVVKHVTGQSLNTFA